MALLALGINHKTAPLDVREKVAFTPEQLVDALERARVSVQLREMAILSTCNRTELYCSTDLEGSRALLDWLGQYHRLDPKVLQQCSYMYWDNDAAQHMMRVASGLDSLVLGEPQILGQLKSAYALSQEHGLVGAELGRLFQQTFAIAKQVRTDTAIGQNPVSVAYAAVSLAQHIFSDLGTSRALLIGAGETIELVARHLQQAGVKSMTVANRTLSRGRALAESVGANAILLGDIPDALAESDIVIASTASQLPILGKGAVERALKKRKHKPIFMVDIAVPRDIEPQVGELDDVYLYSVDDLQEVIEENQRSREMAALDAEAIIERGAGAFMRQLRELEAVDTVTALRRRTEVHRDEALEQALKQLRSGKPAEDVLKLLANRLTNKILHTPTTQLRKASADGRSDLLQLAQELYQLTDTQGSGS